MLAGMLLLGLSFAMGAADSCTDSDASASDPNKTLGTVVFDYSNGSMLTATDECSTSGGYLTEYNCNAYTIIDYIYSNYFKCSTVYGTDWICSEGACVNNATTTCVDTCSDTDSTAKDYNKTKGTVTWVYCNGTVAPSYTDQCVSSSALQEYSCGTLFKTVNCSKTGPGYICKDGACTNSTKKPRAMAPEGSGSSSSLTAGGTLGWWSKTWASIKAFLGGK